jgi:catechol 2,3-dioxygenase-like lactoylglutathione lyase family enzyme
MQTPALNFVLIYVSDMDAAYHFFTNVLGFEPASEADRNSPGFRQLKSNGGVDFALILPTGEDRGKPGDIELYVKTDDIQATREALIGKGVAAGPVVDRPFGQVVPLPVVLDGVRVVAWLPR